MEILYGVWHPASYQGKGIDNVAFLLDDIGWYGASSFSQWLRDEKFAEMEGNSMLLIRNGDKMIIGCKYATDFHVYASEVPTSVLIDLLEQWGTMCDKRDPSLIGAYITYDNDKFHLEPTLHQEKSEA